MELSKQEFEDKTWEVIGAYYNLNKGYQLTKHQLESFNDFILRKLSQIIDGFNSIEIQHQYIPELQKFKYVLIMDVKNPVLLKPTLYEKDGSTKIMTPNDARQRNYTYSSNICVDIVISAKTLNTEDGEYAIDTKTINNVYIGRIPIMVKSNYCVLKNNGFTQSSSECKYDYGGYFIINGNEKVVISQDRIAENKTYVFLNSKISTYSHIAEIRSVNETKPGVPKITSLKLSSKANQFGRYIRANIHHIKNDIPLFVLFKALGLTSDKEVVKYIVYDFDDYESKVMMKELTACIEEANTIMCPRDALEYLSKYLNITGYPKEILNNKNHRINIIRNILRKEFLPHVGDDFQKKALYLGYMANKLLKCYLGLVDYDDRDSYINKRVDTPGVLMANLFRQYYGKVVKDTKNMIQKEINIGGWKATNRFANVINKSNITKIIKPTIIDSGLRYALATGNWGIKSNKNKQGVAQVLNRMTYPATLSHLRRINTPIEKSGKLVQPRKLHSTQWGIICPSETPEGASVGLVKNLSMMATITISSVSSSVYDHLVSCGTEMFSPDNLFIFKKETKILLNGDIVGTHKDPLYIYNTLKSLKRQGGIHIYTAIVWDIKNNEIRICTEGGRFVRPMYVVENNKIKLTKETKTGSWQDLVLNGVVEFLDVEESNCAMLAMKYVDLYKGNKGNLLEIKYTHLELHPSLMLGVLASSIPFSDHNQAPRNCYQCLRYDEVVWMADGTKKMIADVEVGDEVMTFDPITLDVSTTKVVFQHVSQTTKKIYRITTESGKQITATYDHKFMTYDGWYEVMDFDCNTQLAIFEDNIAKYEYIEVLEVVENCLISDITTESSNHSFIAASGFMVHNSAQAKQAIGIYALNYRNRYDTMSHVLNYPQKPLIRTRMSSILNNDALPNGINAVVAIATYTGLTSC